jgi:phytoene dehydrogenase-like protein
MSDVAIIGAGHNGLVAAFYLAKAGLRPIVFEARDELGGGAVTTAIHPGFLCPTLSHETLLQDRIAGDMDLAHHGVEFLTPPARVCSFSGDGAPLVLYPEIARSVASITKFSAKDADAYPAFLSALEAVASVLAATFDFAPPDVDNPAAHDLWNLVKAGRQFRSLGQRDRFRLLRWLPMPVADLVDEWFATDVLRAMIAAPGLSGTMLGPRSAGSALVLIMREAHRQRAGRGVARVRGGPGALAHALAAAARAAGADIRTGSRVERLSVVDGRVAGVVVGGRTIAAQRVVSAVDPKTTFLKLLDPVDLTPDFIAKMRNYRAAGTVAKVNLALSSLPAFGVDTEALSGRIHLGPELDYLERAFDHAKYGECSTDPWLELTIPSIVDAGLAPSGAHVMSIYVHYAPYRLRHTDWSAQRDTLLSSTLNVLDRYAPGIRQLVVAAELISPSDLESTYGLAGGHIYHGELALDQLFTMRPLLGFARYGIPIPGLFLCGAGTHPGGFLTGASGRLAARAVLATRQF